MYLTAYSHLQLANRSTNFLQIDDHSVHFIQKGCFTAKRSNRIPIEEEVNVVQNALDYPLFFWMGNTAELVTVKCRFNLFKS